MIHLKDQNLEAQLNEATNCEFHYKLQKSSVENNKLKEFFTVEISYEDANIDVVFWFEKDEVFALDMPDTWEDEQLHEAPLPNIGGLPPNTGVFFDARRYDILHRSPGSMFSYPNNFSLSGLCEPPPAIKTKQAVAYDKNGREVRYVVLDEHEGFEELPKYTTTEKPLNWAINPYVDFEAAKPFLKDDTQLLTDYFRKKDLKKCM